MTTSNCAARATTNNGVSPKWFLLALSGCAAFSAWAQRPPAQVDHLQIQSEQSLVRITNFVIEGNLGVSTEDLIAKASAEPGDYRVAQLKAMAESMTALYRERGFMVAQVLLPAQDVTTGKVRFVVMEGRLDEIQISGSARSDLLERVRSLTHSNIPLVNRNALTATDLQQALILAADQTGVKVKGVLEPSSDVGGVRLRVQAEPFEDQELRQYTLGINNQGNEATGNLRAYAKAKINSVFRHGDEVVINVGASDRTSRASSYFAGYTIPLGSSNWRGGLQYTRSTYSLGGDFAALKAEGTSDNLGVTLSYPILRDLTDRIGLISGFAVSRIKDENVLISSNPRTANTLWASLEFNSSRPWYGLPGVTEAKASLTTGKLTFEDQIPLDLDKSGLRKSGSFSILGLEVQRQQIVTDGWVLSGSIRGQTSSKNLDSSLKFALGGSSGVRAFAPGEASGDDGVLARLQLDRLSALTLAGLNGSSRIGVFYDQGWVRYDSDPLASNSENTAKRSGFGLQWGVQLPIGNQREMAVNMYLAKPTGMIKTSQADGKQERVGVDLSLRF